MRFSQPKQARYRVTLPGLELQLRDVDGLRDAIDALRDIHRRRAEWLQRQKPQTKQRGLIWSNEDQDDQK